jgi:hypothetical protein
MDTPEGADLHFTNWPGKPSAQVTRVRHCGNRAASAWPQT